MRLVSLDAYRLNQWKCAPHRLGTVHRAHKDVPGLSKHREPAALHVASIMQWAKQDNKPHRRSKREVDGLAKVDVRNRGACRKRLHHEGGPASMMMRHTHIAQTLGVTRTDRSQTAAERVHDSFAAIATSMSTTAPAVAAAHRPVELQHSLVRP